MIARVDAESRTLTYASAGHATGYVLGKDGSVRCRLDSTAMPLGVEPFWETTGSRCIELQGDDLVIMLTDGVLEAQSDRGTMFGEALLLETLREIRHETCRDIIEQLNDRVVIHCVPHDVVDDVSAVAMKVHMRG